MENEPKNNSIDYVPTGYWNEPLPKTLPKEKSSDVWGVNPQDAEPVSKMDKDAETFAMREQKRLDFEQSRRTKEQGIWAKINALFGGSSKK